ALQEPELATQWCIRVELVAPPPPRISCSIRDDIIRRCHRVGEDADQHGSRKIRAGEQRAFRQYPITVRNGSIPNCADIAHCGTSGFSEVTVEPPDWTFFTG